MLHIAHGMDVTHLSWRMEHTLSTLIWYVNFWRLPQPFGLALGTGEDKNNAIFGALWVVWRYMGRAGETEADESTVWQGP